MNMNSQTNGGYIGYEYKELAVDGSQIYLYLDGYTNFGWIVDERQSGPFETSRVGKVVIRLKRDRKIMNKTELTRLQRNFEDVLGQIHHMEQAKTSLATSISIMIGVIGTAFMAGSTFAVTNNPPYILLCILLAIPGFIGWILPYFVYKNIVINKTKEIESLIEDKRDELDEICEKGHRLLL